MNIYVKGAFAMIAKILLGAGAIGLFIIICLNLNFETIGLFIITYIILPLFVMLLSYIVGDALVSFVNHKFYKK